MVESLLTHWPQYSMECALLALFMIAACVAVVIVNHPLSPVARVIRSPLRRRVVIGVLMGLTAVALIYSPWGQRSGAHMNPATTLTFFVLGKVQAWDALFYIAAQFVGALLGVRLAGLALGRLVAHGAVNYAATTPGQRGGRTAWLAEFAIAFGMMSMVLWSTNHAVTQPFTGLFAGALVASYIAIEAPLSGMSMNPARSLGSAIPARALRCMWIYFTAPPLAMLCAAGLYVAVSGLESVYCARLNHTGRAACIFNCRVDRMPGGGTNRSPLSGIQRNSDTPHPDAFGP